MTPTHTFPARASGFTLIELMLTVMIAAILLGIAVPNFRDIIWNNRLTATSNDLLRSTQLARSEAVKRQARVVVCATADAMATQPACNYGAFSQWIVFVDTDGDWTVDSTEAVLDRHGAPAASVNVRSDNDGLISYAPTGFANPPSAGKTPSRYVVICDQRGNQQIGDYSTARALVVEATGRVRVTKNHSDVDTAVGVTGACP
jgi:type IV fimbrial biogenesis protein FimT